jgi:hypothetical protein
MAKIKKLYTYSNKKQIWRLLPTDTNKIVLEERNTEAKEAFFNCIDMRSGKNIFKNLQFEEKYWIGIETIYGDIIFFHKFAKPDMPGHLGITAYDIIGKKILWKNDQLAFLFIYNDEVFCYREGFEGRSFYKINYLTGELNEFGRDADQINLIREKSLKKDQYKNCIFPNPFNISLPGDDELKIFFREFKEKLVIAGSIEYVLLNNILLFNYHEVMTNGSLKNQMKAVELKSKKLLFEEVLNKEIKAIVPSSFFVMDDLIFLLAERVKLEVCSIKE